MNIFVLDRDPVKAAQLQADKHVIKMILESAQVLSTVSRKYGVESKYKSTHANHPCTVWAGKHKDNYKWLVTHAMALCKEYTYRYGKIHKSQEIIEQLQHAPAGIPEGSSEFVQCMPEEFRQTDVVKAYQAYYNTKTFAKWSKREVPEWFVYKSE